ncbi:hypothetical protein [Shewanella mangrovisoli]|uniref:Uncharacterized protein n=1 Tax=Shewanella mangrovisoli TaxID=2864211 RepID=A0ABV4VHX4_9GAMM
MRVNIRIGLPATMPQAMLTVDIDPDAERLIVMDRMSLEVLRNHYTDITKIIVPMRFATSNNLVVGIVDDNGEYNCKFLDGVQAEIIDGLVTSIHA